jgi:hypothetical protein
MHTGEEWFTLGGKEYAAMAVLLATYLLLAFWNKLPTMAAFKDFTDTINTAGGHIVVLLFLTLLSIKVTMQLFYHVLGLPDDSFTKTQAVINMGLSFTTGTLVGLPLGALIKTMTGGFASNSNNPVLPDSLRASFVRPPEEKK